jgi:hypothetical protein
MEHHCSQPWKFDDASSRIEGYRGGRCKYALRWRCESESFESTVEAINKALSASLSQVCPDIGKSKLKGRVRIGGAGSPGAAL